MAGEIGKAGLILTVNGVEFEAKLKQAGDKVDQFKKTVDKANLRDYAEGVGRVREALGSLQKIDFADPISSMMALKSAIELTVLSAKSLKVALLSTGVGALLVGAGALISWLTSRGEERGPSRTPTDSAFSPTERDRAAFLDRLRAGGPAAFPGALGPGRSFGETTTEGMMRALAAATPTGADIAALAPRFRPEFGVMYDPHRARRDSAMERLDAAAAARAGVHRGESDSRIGGAGLDAAALGRTTAMMGMGAVEAERYRASLTRVTREVDGVSITTEESMTPLERHIRRVEEARTAFTGLADAAARVDAVRRESAGMMHREELAMHRLTEAVAARERAALREADRSPLERASRRIAEISALAAGDVGDRAIGSMLAGLTARGSDVGRNAPSALMEGTVAAVDTANRLMREASMAAEDPVERTIRVLETIKEAEDLHRRETEAIGRAVRDGRIILPARR